MSIGFAAQAETLEGGVRVLRRLALVEVSVVSSFPAYPGTSASLRARTPRRARLARYLETL